MSVPILYNTSLDGTTVARFRNQWLAIRFYQSTHFSHLCDVPGKKNYFRISVEAPHTVTGGQIEARAKHVSAVEGVDVSYNNPDGPFIW